MSQQSEPGRDIEKAFNFDRIGAVLLTSTAPARMVVWAAVMLVLSVVIGHIGGALTPTMDFKPDANMEYTVFKRLFMFSRIVEAMTTLSWYLGMALVLWACAREISQRSAARG